MPRAATHLLTRPIRDVIVLMLPLCVTLEEIDLAVDAIEKCHHRGLCPGRLGENRDFETTDSQISLEKSDFFRTDEVDG